MTVADLNKLAGVERAMILDEFDAQGIDRLAEDEGGIFIPDPIFEDVPGYMYFLPNEG